MRALKVPSRDHRLADQVHAAARRGELIDEGGEPTGVLGQPLGRAHVDVVGGALGLEGLGVVVAHRDHHGVGRTLGEQRGQGRRPVVEVVAREAGGVLVDRAGLDRRDVLHVVLEQLAEGLGGGVADHPHGERRRVRDRPHRRGAHREHGGLGRGRCGGGRPAWWWSAGGRWWSSTPRPWWWGPRRSRTHLRGAIHPEHEGHDDEQGDAAHDGSAERVVRLGPGRADGARRGGWRGRHGSESLARA